MENEDNDVTGKQGTVRTLDESNATLQSKTSKSWVTSATEGEMARETWYYTWRAMRDRFYPHYVFYPQDPRFWDDADVYEDNTIPMGYGISYNSLTRIPMTKPKPETDTSTTGSRRLSAYRKSCTYFLIVMGILLLLTATIPVLLHLFLGKEQEHSKPEGVVHTRLELERLEYMPEMSNKSHPEFDTLKQTLQHEIDEIFSKSDVKRYYKGSTIVKARNKSSNVQVHVDLHFNPIDRKIPLYRQLINILHSVPRDVNDSRVGVLGKYRFRINSVDMYDTDLIYPKQNNNGQSTSSIKGNNVLKTTTDAVISSSQAPYIRNDLSRINISPNEKDKRVQRPIIHKEAYNDSTTSLLTTTKQYMSDNDFQTEAPANDFHQTSTNSTPKASSGDMFNNDDPAATYYSSKREDSLNVSPPTVFPNIENLDFRKDFSNGRIIVIKGKKRNNLNTKTTTSLAETDYIDHQNTTTSDMAFDAHETSSTSSPADTITEAHVFTSSSHETEIITQSSATSNSVLLTTGTVYPIMENINQTTSHIFSSNGIKTFSPTDEYIDDYVTETPLLTPDLSTTERETFMSHPSEYWKLPEINSLSTIPEPVTKTSSEANDLKTKQRYLDASADNTLSPSEALSILGSQENTTYVNTQSFAPLLQQTDEAGVKSNTTLSNRDSTPSPERGVITTMSNIGESGVFTDHNDTVSTRKISTVSSDKPIMLSAYPSTVFNKAQTILSSLDSTDKIIPGSYTPSSTRYTTPVTDKTYSETTKLKSMPKATGHDTYLHLMPDLNRKNESVLTLALNTAPLENVFNSATTFGSVGGKTGPRDFVAATPSRFELGMYPVTNTVGPPNDMRVVESSANSASSRFSDSTLEKILLSTSIDPFVLSTKNPLPSTSDTQPPLLIANMAQFINRILIPKSRTRAMTISKGTKPSIETTETLNVQPRGFIRDTFTESPFITGSAVSNKMTTTISSPVAATSTPAKSLSTALLSEKAHSPYERAIFTLGLPIMPLETKSRIDSKHTMTTESFERLASDRSKEVSRLSGLTMNKTTNVSNLLITQTETTDKYFSSTAVPDKADSSTATHSNTNTNVTAESENMIPATMSASTQSAIASFASPIISRALSSAKSIVTVQTLSSEPISEANTTFNPSTEAHQPTSTQNPDATNTFAGTFLSNIHLQPISQNATILKSDQYSAITKAEALAQTSTTRPSSTKYVPSIKYLWTVNLDNFPRPVVKEDHKVTVTAMKPNSFAIKDPFVVPRLNYKTNTFHSNFVYSTQATSTPSDSYYSNSATSVSQTASTPSSKSNINKYRSPEATNVPLSVTEPVTLAFRSSTPTTPQYKPDIKYLWTAGLDLFSDFYNKGNVIAQPDTKWKSGTLSNDIQSNQPAFVVGSRDFKVIKGDSLQPKETLIISNDKVPVSFSNWPALGIEVTPQDDQQNVISKSDLVPPKIVKETITSPKSVNSDNRFIKENVISKPNSEEEETVSDKKHHIIKSLPSASSLMKESTTSNLLTAFISRDRIDNGAQMFFDISNRLESLSSRNRPDTSFLNMPGTSKRNRKQGFNSHTTPIHLNNPSTLQTPTDRIIEKTTEDAGKKSTQQNDTSVQYTLNVFNAEAGAHETVQTTLSTSTAKTTDSVRPMTSSTNSLMFTKPIGAYRSQTNASSTESMKIQGEMTAYKENIVKVTKETSTMSIRMRSKPKQTTQSNTEMPATSESISSAITTANTINTTSPADVLVISKTFRDTSLNRTKLPDIIFIVNTTAVIGKPVTVSWNLSNIRGWSTIVLKRLPDLGDTEIIGVISSTTKVPSSEFSRLKISSKSKYHDDIAEVVIDIPQVLCVDAGTYIAEVVENGTLSAEHRQTLNVYGAPEARVVVPDNLFEGDPVIGIKCIASIGHPPGKLFLRVKYPDSGTFINSLIEDPSKYINYPSSGACKPVAMVNFEDVLDQVRDLNNTIVQCGVTDTPAITSLFRVVMSEYKYIRQIPADVCVSTSSTLIPHPFHVCSSYIDCSTKTVASCPDETCFDSILRRCVQQIN